MVREYENIHCHTMYSNIGTWPDSPARIEQYAAEYADRGMHCLCMSEHGNRSNVWLQADTADKYTKQGFDMKAICAAEVYFVPDREPEKVKDKRNFHLLLLAKNNDGFKELNKAISEANLSGYYYKPRVDFEILEQLNYKNFLCTTACVGGIFKDPEGEKYACHLAEIFKENFRLEVQYHLNDKQIAHNMKVLDMYRKYGWPLIFATDSHYITADGKESRTELQLSKFGSMGRNEESDDEDWLLYLPTAQEAYDCLVKQNVLSNAQIEEAFDNTLEVRTFEGFTYDRSRKFPISRPQLSMEERNQLYADMVLDGYNQRVSDPKPEEIEELKKEIQTITETNSADYFIGLYDMLELGKKKGGIVTPTSRGSACGFPANFSLHFTEINSLRTPVKMYPDRFISKAKLLSGSMPDIDTNLSNLEAFEQAGKEIFGEYGCLPMVAFGTNKTLSAFKLLAKARNLDFSTANEVSKQIKNYEFAVKHAIENNADDPDYDVDDDVRIEDYVEEQYIGLIEDSKPYQGIIMSISPHPCAHLVYHKDLREEIGVIRLKPKAGTKKPVFAAYIDGATADAAGFCKSDLLQVDVVSIMNSTFKEAGKKMLTVDELINEVNKQPEVYSVYANGYTVGVNQFEGEKTTERTMQFKPKNIVELTAMVAAIRPGAKSMVDDFVSRSPHTYGIPTLDKLLKLEGSTGITGKSSYLFYDEQVMTLAQKAGIDPADAYVLLKSIKKKKAEKVLSYKQKFIPGFVSYLEQEEGADADLAEATSQDIFKTIENAGAYLFNASHAYAYALDGLYCAYLKYNYPYEFYKILLELYTKKGNQVKISRIIDEMRRFKGITLSAGKFRQDNRVWRIDKENHAISQNLSSLKFISKQAAETLYNMKDMQFSSFTSLLRHFQMMNPITVNRRAIYVLIYVNYFEEFGKRDKLLKIADEFYKGQMRVTKTLKSYEKRMTAIDEMAESVVETDINIKDIVAAEKEFIGICLSCDPTCQKNLYYIEDVEVKYKIIVKLYSLQRGTHGVMRIKRDIYNEDMLKAGNILTINEWAKKPKWKFQNGKSVPVKGEYEFWIYDYDVQSTAIKDVEQIKDIVAA